MTEKLNKCGCGEIPEYLMTESGSSCKYAFVCGSCCNEWSIQFRSTYTRDDDKLMELATTAWNNASRG